MFGFGSNNQLGRQDGIYDGMAVIAGTAAATQIKVEKGLYIIGDKEYEQKPADVADISLPAATPLGTAKVWLNHPDAQKEVAGVRSDIDAITINVKEADKTDRRVNGSDSYTEGRSLLLADLTIVPYTGIMTLTGTWAADDVAGAVIGGTPVTVALVAGENTPEEAAAALKAAIEANATAAAKVTITRSGAALTFSSTDATAHSLTKVGIVTAGDGDATLSTLSGGASGNLHNGGISAIDNTAKFKAFASNYSQKNL